MGQSNCFFPVHEQKEEEGEEVEEEEEKEDEEKEEEEKKEEKEITTAMQSFTAMQNSCTHGPRLSCPTFLSKKLEEEEEEIEEELAIVCFSRR